MKNTKNLSVLSILLFALLIIMAIGPVSAKNLNLPPGADKIYYFNAGGSAEVALPKGLPGYPSSATGMRFSVVHFEIPNSDIAFDDLLVWLYVKPGPTVPLDWYPFAVFTTNDEYAAFARNYFSGSFVFLDATKYYMNPPTNTIPFPASYGTNNVVVVNEGVLTVDRKGNSITVNLNTPQQFKRPFTSSTNLALPAFTLELKKDNGGSVHATESNTITGVPGASGYTMVNDYMGFYATGSLESTGSFLDGATINNGFVTMHGTHTFYPP